MANSTINYLNQLEPTKMSDTFQDQTDPGAETTT